MDKTDSISHAGVPGMKWGVRKAKSTGSNKPTKKNSSAKTEKSLKRVGNKTMSSIKNSPRARMIGKKLVIVALTTVGILAVSQIARSGLDGYKTVKMLNDITLDDFLAAGGIQP